MAVSTGRRPLRLVGVLEDGARPRPISRRPPSPGGRSRRSSTPAGRRRKRGAGGGAPRRRRLPAARAGEVVIEAHDLVFRYRERADPALAGCALAHQGRRTAFSLEGTFGRRQVDARLALLVGLRGPQSGLVALGRPGPHDPRLDGWRKRAVAAPQFHENHVLTDTLAFNLLMGRDWPPRPRRHRRGRSGLPRARPGRAPRPHAVRSASRWSARSGWQLSHGERSRLYIARALLAELRADHPRRELRRPRPRDACAEALGCVLERARTLLVIAHP